MAIVVVGGSTKDIGKTALVCAVISALSDFNWTAVKITGHSYEAPIAASTNSALPSSTIWEETVAGQETDTARFLAAGARRALLVTRHDEQVPIEELRQALGNDRNILFESNRIIDCMRPDVCLALAGSSQTELKPSFLSLLRKADALVSIGRIEIESAELPADIPRFELESLDRLPTEMTKWLRSRMDRTALPASTA